MSETADAFFDGGRLCGRVLFASFAQVRAEGEALIDAAEAQVELDLSGLEYSNSLAVGAMVAWYRRASAQGKVVRFSNVPADLRKIIDVSGLEDLLL